jgi:hypothetical protein
MYLLSKDPSRSWEVLGGELPSLSSCLELVLGLGGIGGNGSASFGQCSGAYLSHLSSLIFTYPEQGTSRLVGAHSPFGYHPGFSV